MPNHYIANISLQAASEKAFFIENRIKFDVTVHRNGPGGGVAESEETLCSPTAQILKKEMVVKFNEEKTSVTLASSGGGGGDSEKVEGAPAVLPLSPNDNPTYGTPLRNPDAASGGGESLAGIIYARSKSSFLFSSLLISPFRFTCSV